MARVEEKNYLQSIYSKLENRFNDVVSWRRYMHEHPELSFQEKETAKFIAEKLESFGLDVKTNVGGNGVIGILQGAHEGKKIAFRADFDALPIQDEKDVPYKSKVAGVMHACGHDGHTSALLGTAQTLSDFRDTLKGTIIFIFQHAEELPPGGAKEIVATGILDGVEAVYGAHLASDIPVGKVAVGSGYQMAAVDKFKITIKGKGGHGARPHTTVDSIVVGTEVVNALQKIVSRRINPLQSAVVTIGVFQAGKAFNVIADTATIEGTVRTFDGEVRDQIEEEIRTIVEGVTASAYAGFEIDYLRGYPSLKNDEEKTELIKELFTNKFTEENVLQLTPSMGAEDFSYFLQEKPGSYFRVGSQNADEATQFPHHHPNFDIDEKALLMIEKSFAAIAHHYLIKNA